MDALAELPPEPAQIGETYKAIRVRVRVRVKVRVRVRVRVRVTVRFGVRIRVRVWVRVRVMMGRTSLIPTRPTLTIKLYPPILSEAAQQAPDVF